MKQAVLALALGALACGGTDDAKEQPRGPVEDPTTGLMVAACGLPQYELLPHADLGVLLDSDATPETWKPVDLDTVAKLAKIKLDPVPHGAKLYRYRYTTQYKGRSVEATSALAVPDGGAPLPASVPTLLWLHGTTGWSDACAAANDINARSFVALLAGLGWVVVAPDFIGMTSFGEPSTEHHPWLVAEPTVLSAWDALPAASELADKLGTPSVSPKLAIAGPSQGGHATLFAERYAPYYAPEYEIIAQAALVPASSVTQVLENGTSESVSKNGLALFPPLLVTYRDWYRRPGSMGGILTDTDPHHFASRADEIVFDGDCVTKVEFSQASSPSEIYEQAFLDAARADVSALEPWGCYATENSIATTSNPPKLTSTPTLLTFAENDELLLGTDPDVLALCQAGYVVEHVSCAGAGHVSGALWSLPNAVAWLKDRVAGKPVDASAACKLNAPVCCSGNPDCP